MKNNAQREGTSTMKQFIIIRKKVVWQVAGKSVQQVTQALNSLGIKFLAVEELKP